jgi:hypothetical protein
MRKRSFHSSVTCWFAPHTKESSIDTPTFETLDSSSLKPVRKVKPVKVAKRAGVTTIVKGKLEQSRKDGTLHSILDSYQCGEPYDGKLSRTVLRAVVIR